MKQFFFTMLYSNVVQMYPFFHTLAWWANQIDPLGQSAQLQLYHDWQLGQNTEGTTYIFSYNYSLYRTSPNQNLLL